MADNIIAEEIIGYQFTGKETLKELNSIFFDMMKKHNIEQDEPVYNEQGKQCGRNGDRFEWTLYKTLWLSTITHWLSWNAIFPDDD
jgi:hypothetical protein